MRIFKYQIDTVDLAKNVVKYQKLNVPENYKLATLYKYCTTNQLQNAHNAINDVDATVEIFTFTQFWNKRKDYIKYINWERIRALQTNSTAVQANDINDSDTDDDSTSDDSVETAVDSDTESNDEFALHWSTNTNFTGCESKSKFCETFQNINTRNANSQPTRLDVQVASNSVNSVMKSWRYIFTDHILNKIVKYTNDYEETYCKD